MLKLRDKIWYIESEGGGGIHKFSCDLGKLAGSFCGWDFDRGIGNKGSSALLGIKNFLNLQFLVGLADGIKIDLKCDCQSAHGGKLVTALQFACCDAKPYLVDDLTVERHATVVVEAETDHGRGKGVIVIGLSIVIYE